MRAHLLFVSIVAAFMVASVSAASAQTVQFFAVLAGPNETPAGDSDGQGVASVMLGASGQVCFSILTRMIVTPTAAHIHEGNAGVSAGPIRVTLTTPAATGVAGSFASAGWVAGQDTAVLARLRSVPTNFYINVHSASFPGGAVRGQLF